MIKEKWEQFGEKNPYYAVATIDKFNKRELTEDIREEFFETGEKHIGRVFDEIEENFAENFSPRKTLDFGCGVGRLVVPLSKRSGQVVGVDISENMLETALKNCLDLNIENAEFFQTDEFFSGSEENFDLIHSFIVFQHIKPKIGLDIFEKLIERLNENGIGVLHFTFDNPATRFGVLRFKIYRDVPLIYRIRNFLKKSDRPLFPMYEYDLGRIFKILQKNGCHKIQVRFSFHGLNGAVIFFQKQTAEFY